MIDRTGTNCPACNEGVLLERCLEDDWHGMLTCGHCTARLKRHIEEEKGDEK